MLFSKHKRHADFYQIIDTQFDIEYKEIKMKRRLFLKGSLAAASAATAVGAGLLTPSAVFANTTKFKNQSNDIKKMIDDAEDGNFKFKAPEVAENGSVVPMTIDATNMSNVASVAFFVEKNKTPLAAIFDLPNANAFVATRIKMGESSEVTAMVTTTNGKTYIKSRPIKVTLGGCGG